MAIGLVFLANCTFYSVKIKQEYNLALKERGIKFQYGKVQLKRVSLKSIHDNGRSEFCSTFQQFCYEDLCFLDTCVYPFEDT